VLAFREDHRRWFPPLHKQNKNGVPENFDAISSLYFTIDLTVYISQLKM